ncbi:hypothetical protein [Streptomyces sp. NPDC046712]|uniref:hypothetical protein n=1 Tax=Streptomyces sp. NPDC046712 TaxID=3154802 RepID=UPI0033DB6D72
MNTWWWQGWQRRLDVVQGTPGRRDPLAQPRLVGRIVVSRTFVDRSLVGRSPVDRTLVDTDAGGRPFRLRLLDLPGLLQ